MCFEFLREDGDKTRNFIDFHNIIIIEGLDVNKLKEILEIDYGTTKFVAHHYRGEYIKTYTQ